MKNKNYFKAVIKNETQRLAFEHNITEEYAMNCIANLISRDDLGDYRNIEYLGKLFNKLTGYDAIALNCELRHIRKRIINEIYE